MKNIMENKQVIDKLNEDAKDTLMETLGIVFVSATDTTIIATMPVNRGNCQPFGILHGGASLALAESVAGKGSDLLAQKDENIFGVQVSGNHIAAAKIGEIVTATATIMHKGKSTHVWNVDIKSSSGKLVSTVRVMNYVLKK